MARSIMNLSQSSSPDSTLGELGWVGSRESTDLGYSDLLDVQMLRRLINSPSDSIPHRVVHQLLMSPEGKLTNYTIKLMSLLSRLDCNLAQLYHTQGRDAKSFVNKRFYKVAERQWQRRIADNKSHSETYPPRSKLQAQPYLDLPTFRGRTLLTKIRVNDLTLNAAGYNTQDPTNCTLCGEGYETRLHFVVSCPALQHIRCNHMTALPSLRGNTYIHDNSELTIYRKVILYYPPRNVAVHAPRVGHLLADLWYERWKLMSEIDSTLTFAPHYP